MDIYHGHIFEMDKLQKCYRYYSNFSNNTIVEINSSISLLKSDILSTSSFDVDILHTFSSSLLSVKESISNTSSQHRNIHPNVSKLGKAIEKHFVQEYSYLLDVGLLKNADNNNALLEIIQMYLYRNGFLSSIRSFQIESDVYLDKDKVSICAMINQISDFIFKKDVQPALEWCEKNRCRLDSIHSKLELMLFELHYIFLVRSGNVQHAIQFANSMYHLALHYTSQIQKILCCICYTNCPISNDMIASTYTEQKWEIAAHTFQYDAFLLENLPVSCPLTLTIGAGCYAIPCLVKMKIVIQQQEKYDVLSKYDELPINIDLVPCLRFHSVFACPILRQQALDIGSQPIRLICGHLIGYDSMRKIITSHGQVKCPYCPLQMHESEIMHIII